jgi:hypothetical protein
MYAPFFEVLLCVLEEFHGDSWGPDLAQEWHDAFDLTAAAMTTGHQDGQLCY